MKKLILLPAIIIVFNSCKKNKEVSCYNSDDAPVISLKGDRYVGIDVGKTFVDSGYTAIDKNGHICDEQGDGDLTSKVIVQSPTISTNIIPNNEFKISYSVKDKDGNETEEYRHVYVTFNLDSLIGNWNFSIKNLSTNVVSSSYTCNITKTNTVTVGDDSFQNYNLSNFGDDGNSQNLSLSIKISNNQFCFGCGPVSKRKLKIMNQLIGSKSFNSPIFMGNVEWGQIANDSRSFTIEFVENNFYHYSLTATKN